MNNSSTVLPDNITTSDSASINEGSTVITSSTNTTNHTATQSCVGGATTSASADDAKTTVAPAAHNTPGATPSAGVGGGAPSVEATKISSNMGEKTEVAKKSTISAATEEKTLSNPKTDEATVAVEVNMNNGTANVQAEESKSDSRVGKVVVGAIGGVLLGSAAAYAAVHSMKGGSPMGVDSGDLTDTEVDTIAAELKVAEHDSVVDDDLEIDKDILEIVEDDGEEYIELTAEEAASSEGGLSNLISKIVSSFTGESVDNSSDDVIETTTENVPEDIAAEQDSAESMAAESGDRVASEEIAEEAPAVDDEPQGVSFAHDITDDMSFNEAFAAARAEVGAGGAFEWRGNIYGTYYADEWNNMSDDEKDAFGRSFDFGGADSDYGKEDVADVVSESDDIVEVVDDDDNIEILGIADDDIDVEIELVNDDDIVMVDVDAFEDDDSVIDLTEDAIFDDDVDVVENLFDDADDMAWTDNDIFA